MHDDDDGSRRVVLLLSFVSVFFWIFWLAISSFLFARMPDFVHNRFLFVFHWMAWEFKKQRKIFVRKLDSWNLCVFLSIDLSGFSYDFFYWATFDFIFPVFRLYLPLSLCVSVCVWRSFVHFFLHRWNRTHGSLDKWRENVLCCSCRVAVVSCIFLRKWIKIDNRLYIAFERVFYLIAQRNSTQLQSDSRSMRLVISRVCAHIKFVYASLHTHACILHIIYYMIKSG